MDPPNELFGRIIKKTSHNAGVNETETNTPRKKKITNTPCDMEVVVVANVVVVVDCCYFCRRRRHDGRMGGKSIFSLFVIFDIAITESFLPLSAT